MDDSDSSFVIRPPDSLRKFLKSGNPKYRGEDGDWAIKLEPVPPAHLAKSLPSRVLIIGNNGCGDHLFLTPEPNSPTYGRTVYVFWHDETRVEKYLDDVDALTAPPVPAPSHRAPVLYFGGENPVMPGDRVTVRGVLQFWRRFPGQVTYVPGISKKNRDLEHDGLAWAGIKLDKGYVVGIFVDEKTACLTKRVRFVGRATSPVNELGPNEDLE